jgi:hypothetical protein
MSGRITTVKHTDIASQIIARIVVREDNGVRAGQALVHRRNDEVPAALQQASAAMAQTEA